MYEAQKWPLFYIFFHISTNTPLIKNPAKSSVMARNDHKCNVGVYFSKLWSIVKNISSQIFDRLSIYWFSFMHIVSLKVQIGQWASLQAGLTEKNIHEKWFDSSADFFGFCKKIIMIMIDSKVYVIWTWNGWHCLANCSMNKPCWSNCLLIILVLCEQIWWLWYINYYLAVGAANVIFVTLKKVSKQPVV